MAERVFHSVEEFERAMFPRSVEARKRALETPREQGERAAEEALARVRASAEGAQDA